MEVADVGGQAGAKPFGGLLGGRFMFNILNIF